MLSLLSTKCRGGVKGQREVWGGGEEELDAPLDLNEMSSAVFWVSFLFWPAKRSGEVTWRRCFLVTLTTLCYTFACLNVALLPVGPRKGSVVCVGGCFFLFYT